MRLKFHIEKASKPQIKYIEILTNDLKIPTRGQRNAHISEIVKRRIIYLDELTMAEAQLVIKQFLDWKEAGKNV